MIDNLTPKPTIKRIYHETYPIEITGLQDWEIENLIKHFCEVRNMPYQKSTKSKKSKNNE